MHEEAASSSNSQVSSDIDRKADRPAAMHVVSDNEESEEAAEEDIDMQNNGGALMFTDMQDKFLEIIDPEEVEDVIDLNEKFLSMALGGIEVTELAMLTKLELRVDTQCHSL
jgi:hypothetical protein